MSRNRDRNKSSRPTALDEARNELFGHIHRCGVMQATREQQEEWMTDTIQFLGERHTALTERELKELAAIGMRFCSPVIANADAASASEAVAQQETAAA
ncbi:MAG: hypothetical protein KY467_14965 [Gemmatimonadetes bacterium]|nr:hypothetical protein [Gemmatimonadota bacterium]